MTRTPTAFTKQRKVLGVPLGRRTTDWKKVGLVGLGVASSLAGGVGAVAARVRGGTSDPSSNGSSSPSRSATKTSRSSNGTSKSNGTAKRSSSAKRATAKSGK